MPEIWAANPPESVSCITFNGNFGLFEPNYCDFPHPPRNSCNDAISNIDEPIGEFLRNFHHRNNYVRVWRENPPVNTE